MAGGLLGIKPTPNVFSNGEKADVAGESLVYTGPSNPHLACSGGTPPMVISGRQQTRFGKLHSANLNFARGTYLSPNAFWLRKTTLA